MERLTDLLTQEQASAIDLLRTTMGFDPAHDSSMWEHLLAHITAGTTTAKGESHDLDLLGALVEVKYSREFSCRLGDRHSQVFRWTALCGHGKAAKTASVLVLVGLDDDRNVWFWVIPYSSIGTTNTVTSVVPSRRIGASKSNLDGYQCKSSDLLPTILHYDRDHHAETRAATKAALAEVTP